MNLLSSMLALWSAISAVGLACAALIVVAELRSAEGARGEEPVLLVQQAQGTPAERRPRHRALVHPADRLAPQF